MRKFEKPLGVTLLAWIQFMFGGILISNFVFTSLWNVFLANKTNIHWGTESSPIEMLPPIGYILLGIGLLKSNRIAYFVTMIFSGLAIFGGVGMLNASMNKSENAGTGIAVMMIVFSFFVVIYLMKKWRHFFDKKKKKKLMREPAVIGAILSIIIFWGIIFLYGYMKFF